MKYKAKKPTYHVLRDMAIAAEYGALTADRRIQVKMPSYVVDALDQAYPHQDRSALLTQLAIESLMHRARFADRPDLGELVASEQEGLDRMWEYLEERETHVK